MSQVHNLKEIKNPECGLIYFFMYCKIICIVFEDLERAVIHTMQFVKMLSSEPLNSEGKTHFTS